MRNVKISVLKKTIDKDLVGEYGTAGGVCDRFAVGQEIMTDGSQPQGMCPMAWHMLSPYVQVLGHGSTLPFDEDQGMNQTGTAIISCGNGLRPVVFKLEACTDEEHLDDMKDCLSGAKYSADSYDPPVLDLRDKQKNEPLGEGEKGPAEDRLDEDSGSEEEMRNFEESERESEDTAAGSLAEMQPQELIVLIWEDTLTVPLMDQFEGYDMDGIEYERMVIEGLGCLVFGEKYVDYQLVVERGCSMNAEGNITMTEFKKDNTLVRKHVKKYITEEIADRYLDSKEYYKFPVPYRLRAQNSRNQTGYGWTWYGSHLYSKGTYYGETTPYMFTGVYLSSSSRYYPERRHEGLNKSICITEESLNGMGLYSVGKMKCICEGYGEFEVVPYDGSLNCNLLPRCKVYNVTEDDVNPTYVVHPLNTPFVFIKRSVLEKNLEDLQWYCQFQYFESKR